MTHLTSCALSGKNIVFMLPDSNLIRPGCGATAHCKSSQIPGGSVIFMRLRSNYSSITLFLNRYILSVKNISFFKFQLQNRKNFTKHSKTVAIILQSDCKIFLF
jgi:hypothetical protein